MCLQKPIATDLFLSDIHICYFLKVISCQIYFHALNLIVYLYTYVDSMSMSVNVMCLFQILNILLQLLFCNSKINYNNFRTHSFSHILKLDFVFVFVSFSLKIKLFD